MNMVYKTREELNKIGEDIIGAAFEVGNFGGRHMLEHYYHQALAYELRLRGHKVECEVLIEARYKGIIIGNALRADIVVDDCIIVECKAKKEFVEGDIHQIYTYLQLTDTRLGYLINFGASDLKCYPYRQNEEWYKKGSLRMVNRF